MADLSSTQDVACTCCPYGFHIHVDFAKFAEEQLCPIKKNNLGCTNRISRNSLIRKKSKEIPECCLNGNLKFIRKQKIKHVNRENAFIQEKILNLQTRTIKTNEDIYGRGLLEAVKEFENFLEKTWGKIRSGREKKKAALRLPIENYACTHCQHKCKLKSSKPSTNEVALSVDFDTSSKGVNTDTVRHFSTVATNTQMERSEPLSKLTIRTRHPKMQTPDCGGEGNIPINSAIEHDKCVEVETILEAKDFATENLKPEVLEPQFMPAQKRPSDDMRAALQVVNDALIHGRTGRAVVASMSVIMNEWFLAAGSETANVKDILNYLNVFESYSPQLLRYMVNIPDLSGITALHYAISYGNYTVVSKLLDTGVTDPNKPNKAGYTSVMLATLADITNDSEEQIVRKLISLSNVNTKAAQYGQTALMLAASHGRFKMVKLLLEAGADVNAQDEDGSTPLMCAVEHGHADIVQCLLAQPGCDLNITDNDGLTALNVAMEADQKDIAVLVYAHMHFANKPSPISTPTCTDDNLLLLSKRSRSSTNPSPIHTHNDPSSYEKNDNHFLAKKQHSSTN